MKNIKKVFVLLFTVTLLGILPLSVRASEQLPATTLTYAIEGAAENANYMLVRNEPRMLNYTHIMEITHLGGEYGSVDEPAVMEVNGATTNVSFYIDVLQADNTRIYAFDLPADAVMVNPPIPQGTELVSIQKNGYDVKIVLRLTGSTVVTALQPKTLGDEWFGVFRAVWGPKLTIDYYGADGVKITTHSGNELIIDPWNPSVFDGNTLSYADASGSYTFSKYGSGIELSGTGGYDGIYDFYESVPPRGSSPVQTAVPVEQIPAAIEAPVVPTYEPVQEPTAAPMITAGVGPEDMIYSYAPEWLGVWESNGLGSNIIIEAPDYDPEIISITLWGEGVSPWPEDFPGYLFDGGKTLRYSYWDMDGKLKDVTFTMNGDESIDVAITLDGVPDTRYDAGALHFRKISGYTPTGAVPAASADGYQLGADYTVIGGQQPINSSGLAPGDYLGDVLYSDIVAYINGYAIPTSITNGRTMVVAEDLRNYGFNVNWDANTWSLNISPNPGAPISPLPVEANTMPVGAVKYPYVYTDITTYLTGQMVESFAIDGKTLIDFELLSQYGNVEWDQATRSLRLTIY